MRIHGDSGQQDGNFSRTSPKVREPNIDRAQQRKTGSGMWVRLIDCEPQAARSEAHSVLPHWRRFLRQWPVRAASKQLGENRPCVLPRGSTKDQGLPRVTNQRLPSPVLGFMLDRCEVVILSLGHGSVNFVLHVQILHYTVHARSTKALIAPMIWNMSKPTQNL